MRISLPCTRAGQPDPEPDFKGFAFFTETAGSGRAGHPTPGARTAKTVTKAGWSHRTSGWPFARTIQSQSADQNPYANNLSRFQIAKRWSGLEGDVEFTDQPAAPGLTSPDVNAGPPGFGNCHGQFGAFFLILVIVVGAMMVSRYIFSLNLKNYIHQVERQRLASIVPALQEMYRA